jgi:hypothetical protein
MKTTTTASNPWLAAQLNMGSPFRLSRLVSLCRTHPQAFQAYVKAMTKCNVCPLHPKGMNSTQSEKISIGGLGGIATLSP